MNDLLIALFLAQTLVWASVVVSGIGLFADCIAYFIYADGFMKETKFEIIHQGLWLIIYIGFGVGALGLVCLYISLYIW